MPCPVCGSTHHPSLAKWLRMYHRRRSEKGKEETDRGRRTPGAERETIYGSKECLRYEKAAGRDGDPGTLSGGGKRARALLLRIWSIQEKKKPWHLRKEQAVKAAVRIFRKKDTGRVISDAGAGSSLQRSERTVVTGDRGPQASGAYGEETAAKRAVGGGSKRREQTAAASYHTGDQ